MGEGSGGNGKDNIKEDSKMEQQVDPRVRKIENDKA